MCTSPILLLNPAVKPLFGCNGNRPIYCKSSNEVLPTHIFVSYRQLYWYFKHDKIDDPLSYSFYDSRLSMYLPLFIQASCRKCNECLMARATSLKHRLLMEASQYDYQPYFVTLTFDMDHLPQGYIDLPDINNPDLYPNYKCSVNPLTNVRLKEYLTLFLKRLRFSVSKSNLPTKTFRHFFISELGPLHNRVHFHGILFGLDSSDSSFEKVTELIDDAWYYGDIHTKLVYNKGGISYVSKYITKSLYIGYTPYISQSIAGGGLGSTCFYHALAENRVRVEDGKYNISFKCFGSHVTISLPSLFFNKMCPSVCQLVSKFYDISQSILTYKMFMPPSVYDECIKILSYFDSSYFEDKHLFPHLPSFDSFTAVTEKQVKLLCSILTKAVMDIDVSDSFGVIFNLQSRAERARSFLDMPDIYCSIVDFLRSTSYHPE